MRRIVLSVCVFAAACCGPVSNSPTSPTGVTLGSANTSPTGDGPTGQTQARRGTDLPFKGSFTLASTSTVNCPPTCPPTILRIAGNLEGTATHLGRFTATFIENVVIVSQTGTGTLTFTAANGDQLFTTTAGGQDAFTPPNVSHVTSVATIVGGTGRFAGATGALTIEFTQEIDFANARASGSGSIEGHISLNK